MSKSVRERALEVLHGAKCCNNRERSCSTCDEYRVDALAAAGLLATHALLECGEACHQMAIADSYWTASMLERTRMAGRALAAEQAGKEWNPPGKDTDYRLVMDPAKPDTSREDAALYQALLGIDYDSEWAHTTNRTTKLTFKSVRDALDFHEALGRYLRKAREPKPRWEAITTGDGTAWAVRGHDFHALTSARKLTEAQARAVALALNSLEA